MKLESSLVNLVDFLSLQLQSTVHLYYLSYVSVLPQRIKYTTLSLGFPEADPAMKHLCMEFLEGLSGEIGRGLEEADRKGEGAKWWNNVRCRCSPRQSSRELGKINYTLKSVPFTAKECAFFLQQSISALIKAILWRSQMEVLSSKGPESDWQGTELVLRDLDVAPLLAAIALNPSSWH